MPGQQALETLRIATAQQARPGRYVAGLLVRLASRESIDDWVTQGEVADAYCWSLLGGGNRRQLGSARAGIDGKGPHRSGTTPSSVALRAPPDDRPWIARIRPSRSAPRRHGVR